MSSVEELFLGHQGSFRKPLFKNAADIAKDIAALEVAWNPYFNRQRTCAKHLSAIFRGGSSERISQALFDVLQIVLQRRIEAIPAEERDKWQIPIDELELEHAVRAYARKFDRTTIDSGLKAFQASLMTAETLAIKWSQGPDELILLAEMILDVLQESKVRIEFNGYGFWEALHRVATKRGHSWDDASDLLLSWQLAKRVAVRPRETDICVAFIDANLLNRKVFLFFPEDNDQLVAFRVPPKSADRLAESMLVAQPSELIPPEMEIKDGRYGLPLIDVFLYLTGETYNPQYFEQIRQTIGDVRMRQLQEEYMKYKEEAKGE